MEIRDDFLLSMNKGNGMPETYEETIYDPQSFLEWINQKPDEWKTNLERNTVVLDKKVTINYDCERYKPVINGMRTIADSVCNELQDLDSTAY